MKPNHHWVVHLPDQLCDFGVVFSFWTFLSERLNKILKSLPSSFQKRGEIEASMLREFHCSIHINNLVSILQCIPSTY